MIPAYVPSTPAKQVEGALHEHVCEACSEMYQNPFHPQFIGDCPMCDNDVSWAKHAIPKEITPSQLQSYSYDKNPYLLSSAISQSTHKSHFKTLRSNNSYHPYYRPVLTAKSITFRQQTTLSIKKWIYPIHYHLSYLEWLGFIEPVTQTYIEIRPGVILCTCKGNTFRFCSRSCHLVSLPQRLRSRDIVRHPLPTRFPSNPPSAYDTLTRHVCRTLHVFTNFGLISYIHYFVY